TIDSDVFFFQAEDGIRDFHVTGVQTCALPIFRRLVSRAGFIAAISRRSLAIRLRMRRRSSSIFVSPGPREPMPAPAPPTWPPARSEERRVGKKWSARREQMESTEATRAVLTIA